jgi:hypothetical protein
MVGTLRGESVVLGVGRAHEFGVFSGVLILACCGCHLDILVGQTLGKRRRTTSKMIRSVVPP